MCKQLLLIIEVDGSSHNNEIAYYKDLKRQKDLEDVGFKVLRFQNSEVLKDMKNVIRCIEITIEEMESKLELAEKNIQKKQQPPPAPSKGGHAPNK